MEILNLLEERVIRLVQEIGRLREENGQILQNSNSQVAELQEQLQNLREENQLLNDLLAQESQVKDDVLQRVDALLTRLKDLD